MATIDLKEDTPIKVNISSEKTLNTEIKDLNYIPEYKEYELERQTNEIKRQSNESNREAYINELKQRVINGEFDGAGIISIDKTSTSGLVDTYTITYSNGNTETYEITNGAKGETGATGPQGETGQQGPKGEPGVAGKDGAKGEDGVSCTHSWNGTTLTITSASGTSSADLKGETGDPGERGPQGIAGNDGVSPTITTSKSGKVSTITIVDAQGTHTATINDGADGQGSGDMLKVDYDTNGNGIVDNAEKVNNHTVESDVPSNAVFTDTTYTAGTGIDITDGVISNTQTSANWGNITGTLSEQTDLNNALDNKVDKITDKGLSTNDYTTTEKEKLAGIAAGAEKNVNADWNSTSGDSQILNKPTLSIVATSGSYSDLSDKPTIPTVPTNLSSFTDDLGSNPTHTHEQYLTEHQDISGKQDILVSGTNIKTIDGTSILGSGNLDVSGDTLPIGAITEFDGNTIPEGYEEVAEMSGSNDNGSWIKYADGTMICYGIFTGTLTTAAWGTIADGNLSGTFTFPQSFINVPIITAVDCSGYSFMITQIISTQTGVSKITLARSNAVSNVNVSVSYIAIGRWKQ